uniref:Putative secreted protein n=1 Tax=Anopheles darlingi TaxID=43151 RepID=A0A2M4D9Z0_ANODA
MWPTWFHNSMLLAAWSFPFWHVAYTSPSPIHTCTLLLPATGPPEGALLSAVEPPRLEPLFIRSINNSARLKTTPTAM